MYNLLIVVAGPDQGQKIPLLTEKPLLLGRGHQVEVPLTDLHISRIHCRVDIKEEKIIVTDQGSTAGTFINGQRVEQQELKPGDVLQIGATQLCLYRDVSDMATVPPDAFKNEPLPFRNQPRTDPLIPVPGLVLEEPPPPQPPSPGARSKRVVLSGDRLGELSHTHLAHFIIGPLIAKGKSGVVFRARDTRKDRVVALKVLRPELARPGRDIDRFIRAMKTALPLKHDNLVRVFGAGKKSGYCWVSMELVEGDSLQQVIRRIGVSGMLDWRHAYRVALHVGRALEYAHQRRVLHRNLTPQNVLIRTGDHLVKLGDLMLAKALEGRLAANLTPQGELLGDLNYMAPEQTVASQEADERSDIYSLGALVYALLTGRPPFEGGSLKETLKQIRTAKPARPRQFQLSIPERFEGTVLTMLAKKPENRFQSAGELLEDLERMARFQNVEI